MNDCLDETIYFPVVWRRTGYGISIEDLKGDRFEDVVTLFKEHYILNDILIKNTSIMKEPESLDSFFDQLLYTMENDSSLVAYDETPVVSEEKTEDTEHPYWIRPKRKIAAALILRTIPKFDYGRVMSRTKLVSGQSMEKLVSLRQHMYRKVDFYAEHDCERILRIYYLCVKPEYRFLELGYQMLVCAVDVARANGAKVVVGLFPTGTLHDAVSRIGFKVLFARILYLGIPYNLQKKEDYAKTKYSIELSQWKDINGSPIFGEGIKENYDLMSMEVPPLPSLVRTAPVKVTPKDVGKKKSGSKK